MDEIIEKRGVWQGPSGDLLFLVLFWGKLGDKFGVSLGGRHGIFLVEP